jgi:hypothetical protein
MTLLRYPGIAHVDTHGLNWKRLGLQRRAQGGCY